MDKHFFELKGILFKCFGFLGSLKLKSSTIE